jgi:hypothetical protein
MSKTLTEQYRGNIPLGKQYKLIEVYYKPKDIDIGYMTSCYNCGIIISNIYTIQDEEGNKYDVGSECVNAILGHSLELIEAKRKLASQARFIKALRTRATSITLHPKRKKIGEDYIPDVTLGYRFRFYGFKNKIQTTWDVNAIGQGDYASYKYIIDKLNIPVTICEV